MKYWGGTQTKSQAEPERELYPYERARQVLHPLGCEFVVRRRVMSDGSVRYWEQCPRCGRAPHAVKATDPRVTQSAELEPFDEHVRGKFDEELSKLGNRFMQEREAKRQAQQQTQQERWWFDYSAYLQTAAWHSRRDRVLLRDSYLCQACRLARATQVHHLTYKHVGNEPLFELVSVCDDCHEQITEMDRTRRGA